MSHRQLRTVAARARAPFPVALLARVVLAVLVTGLLAFPADLPAAEPAAKEPIAWETSYASALAAAKATGKPIVFKFYTGWCPHCTRMDKTTWRDAAVAKAAASFVAAKVNADVEKVPVRRYGLVGYPTVIVAEPGGEAVVRLEGYKNAGAVAAVLDAYQRSEGALGDAFAKLAKDAADPGAHLVVAGFYAGAGLDSQAAERFLKAAKSAQGADLVAASAGAGAALVRAGDLKGAVKALQPGVAAAGEAPPAPLALAMGEALAGLDRREEARAWLERVVRDHSATPEAEAARRALAAL